VEQDLQLLHLPVVVRVEQKQLMELMVALVVVEEELMVILLVRVEVETLHLQLQHKEMMEVMEDKVMELLEPVVVAVELAL
tara:strand:- start:198 stop:440 length:243 start_codon:yes stop_codon:yes gene_type:complete